MTKLVKRHSVFFSAATLVVFSLAVFVRYGLRSAAVAIAAPQAVAEAELAPALLRAGLDAETLAAVGVDAPSVASVVSAFEAAMAAEPQRLDQADADFAAARVSCDRLERTIQSGRGSAADATAYQSALSDFQAAEAAREAALHDFCVAGVLGLSGSRMQTLGTILGNRDWSVPVEFKTVDRSEEEWVALKKALANERIMNKLGEAPDPAHQAFLASLRSDSAVALARSNLDANLDSLRVAWNAAVAD